MNGSTATLVSVAVTLDTGEVVGTYRASNGTELIEEIIIN